MAEVENFEAILQEIEEPACHFLAEQALQSARQALEYRESVRKGYISDQIYKIIAKALKQRKSDETT